MKLKEFEEQLISRGLQPDSFEVYEKLLRRVRGGDSMRLQHCRVTAVKFPDGNYQQAAELLNWGMKQYNAEASWYDLMSGHQSLGFIYERAGQYQEAYEEFLKADQSLQPPAPETYHTELAGSLMWARLHMDDFSYSPQLEEHYNTFQKADSFLRMLKSNLVRQPVCEIVIHLHYGRRQEAKDAYKNAVTVQTEGFVGPLTGLLARHMAADLCGITPECKRFLRKMAFYFLI